MVLSRLPLHKHIRRLKHPRLNRRKRHRLGDILTIAICAVEGSLPAYRFLRVAAKRNFAAANAQVRIKTVAAAVRGRG